MKAKFAAAVLMPVVVVALVVGILRVTHHTTVPPLSLPSTATSALTSGRVSLRTCEGALPERFTGIAVKDDPAAHAMTYSGMTKKKPTIVEFYNKFSNPFSSGEARQALAANAIPLIQLNPRGISLKSIAAGSWDRHLKSYATDIKKFGCMVILSFGHEMNGWWYPWGAPYTTPRVFIAVWRHIHDIFREEGVANVLWSWDPSHQYQQVGAGKVASPAGEWYPGSNYVDLIGLDGYIGYESASGRPQTFAEIFGPQLSYIRRFAPHKTVYLAETGVGPGRAVTTQISELFAGVASRHLAGLVWFDAKAKNDYRLGVHKVDDAAYESALAGYLR